MVSLLFFWKKEMLLYSFSMRPGEEQAKSLLLKDVEIIKVGTGAPARHSVTSLPEKWSATHIRSSFSWAVSFIHVPNVVFIFVTFLGLIRDLIRQSVGKNKKSQGIYSQVTWLHMNTTSSGNVPFLLAVFSCSFSVSFTGEVSSFGIACSPVRSSFILF